MRFERWSLPVLGLVAIVWGVVFVNGRGNITEDSAPAIALAIALAVALVAIGCACGWLVGGSASPTARRTGSLLQQTAILAGIGTMRLEALPSWWMRFVVVAWLAAPAAMVASLISSRLSRRRSRIVAVASGLVTASAVFIGWLAGLARGHRWVDPGTVATVMRLLFVVHLLSIVAATLANVIGTRSADGDRRRVLTITALAWGAVTVVADVIHLRPGSELLPGLHPLVTHSVRPVISYAPWSTMVGVTLPIAATLWLILTVTYVERIRPRLGRTRPGS